MRDGLETRAKALEGAFFARKDQELIAGLHVEREIDALRRASGIEDAALLSRLIEEGIRVESLLALILVPVVAIAWADGQVSALERNAFAAEAAQRGIRPSSAVGQILARWLDAGPPAEMMEAWEGYVESLEQTVSSDGFARLGDEIIRVCRHEADSDGGILRIGRRICEQERSILDRVERAFELV